MKIHFCFQAPEQYSCVGSYSLSLGCSGNRGCALRLRVLGAAGLRRGDSASWEADTMLGDSSRRSRPGGKSGPSVWWGEAWNGTKRPSRRRRAHGKGLQGPSHGPPPRSWTVCEMVQTSGSFTSFTGITLLRGNVAAGAAPRARWPEFRPLGTCARPQPSAYSSGRGPRR